MSDKPQQRHANKRVVFILEGTLKATLIIQRFWRSHVPTAELARAFVRLGFSEETIKNGRQVPIMFIT